MESRALRAISKPNGGWLRPCTLGRFPLLAQRKATKRNDTPEPPTFPATRPAPRESPGRTSLCARSRCHWQRSPWRFSPESALSRPTRWARKCCPARYARSSCHNTSATGSNTRLAAPDPGCDARRWLRGFIKMSRQFGVNSPKNEEEALIKPNRYRES